MSESDPAEPAPPKRASRRKPQMIDLAPRDVQETTEVPEASNPQGASEEPLPDMSSSEQPVVNAEPVSEAPQVEAGTTTAMPEREPELPPVAARSVPEPAKTSRKPSWIPGAIAGAAAAVLLYGVASFLPGLSGSNLADRIAALETKPVPLPAPPPDFKPLTDRIEAVAGQIPALETGLAEAGAGLKSAQTEIQALRVRLDEAATGPNGAPVDQAALDSMSSRLKQAEDAVSALGQEIAVLRDVAAKAAPSAVTPAIEKAVRLSALDALNRRVATGEPFQAEVDAVAPFAGSTPALKVVAAAAGKGMPSLERLANDFLALAPSINAAIQPKAQDQGLLERLAQSATSLVEVTPVDGAADADPASVTARVASAIRRGNLPTALEALNALPDAAKGAAKPTIDALEAHVTFQNALAELGRSVIGSP